MLKQTRQIINPEPYTVYLAQKAMKCRDVEKVMDMFAKINVSPVTISKRHKIKYTQTLDDYTHYLGLNMRPIAEHPDILVPIFRDEQPQSAMQFSNLVGDYRHQLISIYTELYEHMPFFKPA